MPGTLDLCEKFFQTRDLYILFDIPKESLEKDVKKAYYKKALKVHPDRVSESEKDEATEKFKLLSRVYSVLTDKSKRALYDERGIIDDEDEDYESNSSLWLELWKQIFKPISTEDIDNYEKEYKGSDLEKRDIQKAYLGGKGCINFMMDSVPFMDVEDEPRIAVIIQEMISSDEVPDYKIFTNEPKAKRDRRHKKYAREAREARQIKTDMEQKDKDVGNLGKQIMKNQAKRENNSESFFDKLISKYGGKQSEEDDIFDFDACNSKKKKTKKTPVKQQSNKVKTGRIQKAKAKIAPKKKSK